VTLLCCHVSSPTSYIIKVIFVIVYLCRKLMKMHRGKYNKEIKIISSFTLKKIETELLSASERIVKQIQQAKRYRPVQ